jgi:serine phosphatase RsbU (regulator of sigma subunit)
MGLSANAVITPEIEAYIQELARYNKYDSNRVNVLNKISNRYLEIKDPSACLLYANKAYNLSSDLNYNAGIAQNAVLIANVLREQASYLPSLNFYHTALAIYEKKMDSLNTANCQLNIAIVFNLLKEPGEALDYTNSAIHIFTLLRKNTQVIATLNCMGDSYKMQEKKQLALDTYLRALELNYTAGSKAEKAKTYQNLAGIFMDLGKYKQAYLYYLYASKINRNLKNHYELAANLNEIGVVYRELDKYFLAISYCEKAYALSKRYHLNHQMARILFNMGQTYADMGNYELAYEYLTKHKIKYSRIYQTELKQQIEVVQAMYEAEKKDREILKQKKDIQKQASIRNLFALGSGGFIIIILILAKSLRNKKKINTILNVQKKDIEKQNLHITDSINYASRIQKALLPTSDKFNKAITEHFIYYRPRDIVSGDFYWIKHIDKYTLIAAADCTGHGVPGAFMSLLGITFLNEIVKKQEMLSPHETLNELRRKVIESLQQREDDITAEDGMDIALCLIDRENNALQYSGANTPLYLIRNNELIEYKADEMPISGYRSSAHFTNHEIKLLPNDSIYVFSDGIVDQFGGPNNRKFLSKRFKSTLLEINTQTMTQQKELINKIYEQWKGNNKQIDDILVLGIRF